ncbi:2-oxo acid dehydrogenase subunit E2 [uncultured Desulfosarcina sp.]|uniref:2-oxo acid dehydrogenase subunit E2 n=1 Tax=uncultured Desulfosarcina sp. TaxID=218289 RepID=UPI0029C93DD1|nr:2-oxo acid dehydrogenase subunit E2 [uncultured Desulfosarcina sp.]
MIQAIKVPEIGENVESGVVVAVHIKIGDTVAVDDTVIELETDKALVEIPSPFAGRVTEVLAEAGAQMNVGDVIARVETESKAAKADKKPPAPDTATEEPASASENGEEEASPAPAPPVTAGSESQPPGRETTPERPPAPAAPSIRRLARELGVDIVNVSGSGPGGRITEADIKTHVRHRQPGAPGISGSPPVTGTLALPDFSRWGEVHIEEMDTVRRLTAQSTAASWTTIPHVTQFDEADITGVMKFIEKNAPTVETAGAKLTVTAIVTRVCAEALKRFPRFNASIDVANRRIILKQYVHIGIAADTPRGLLVPVIRDADQKSIVDLAKAIGDLAQRARNKKIKPDELEGGTFSISNQGGIGGVGFTPIVLWPQVAILGVSRSAVKPVYVQDRFEPRTILPFSLSYDHRIIDGADAARFLRWICDGLEQPMTLFLD